MRLHRFYLTDTDLGQYFQNKETFLLKDVEITHQLLNVFRSKSGQEIILFNGDGFDYISEIILENKNKINILIKDRIKNNVESKMKVTLCLSLIKKNNFELVVQKATELGVSKIVPVISERSEKKEINIERLNKIATEATEQSGRNILPLISPIVTFDEVVRLKADLGISFEPQAEPFHDLHIYGGSTIPENVLIFIGPEGGWSPREIEKFKENDAKIFSLGQGILRSETAAISALAILLL